MSIMSVTRLNIRSIRFFPAFAWYAVLTQRQARKTDGCLAIKLRREKGLVFWTLSEWRNDEAMKNFMINGAHRLVMLKLSSWCNEASVARWDSTMGMLPDWTVVAERLRQYGRLSHVNHPSAAHSRGETLPQN